MGKSCIAYCSFIPPNLSAKYRKQILCEVSFSVSYNNVCSVAQLCSWNFPDKNTGVGCHFLLQGLFPTQGLNHVFCIFSPGRLILYHCATWEARILSHVLSMCSENRACVFSLILVAHSIALLGWSYVLAKPHCEGLLVSVLFKLYLQLVGD